MLLRKLRVVCREDPNRRFGNRRFQNMVIYTQVFSGKFEPSELHSPIVGEHLRTRLCMYTMFWAHRRVLLQLWSWLGCMESSRSFSLAIELGIQMFSCFVCLRTCIHRTSLGTTCNNEFLQLRPHFSLFRWYPPQNRNMLHIAKTNPTSGFNL